MAKRRSGVITISFTVAAICTSMAPRSNASISGAGVAPLPAVTCNPLVAQTRTEPPRFSVTGSVISCCYSCAAYQNCLPVCHLERAGDRSVLHAHSTDRLLRLRHTAHHYNHHYQPAHHHVHLHLQEILNDLFAMHGQYALGMELYALNRQLAMTKSHDRLAVGSSG